MIQVYPWRSLGNTNLGWLNTHYHFSFADYHDPKRMGFGNLRVINDDTIQPGTGFPMHPHSNMEIVTYVTQGAITHKDSEENQGRIKAGDVQVMSAGTGVYHSEYNLEPIETKLFQIWIKPRAQGLAPSWTTQSFPDQQSEDGLSLLVSGDGTAPLTINQDARIFAGALDQNKSITQPLKTKAYLVMVSGELNIDGQVLKQGDGAEITDRDVITIHASTESKLLLIEI